METNQSAARAARRFLDDRVRSDWDFPDTPDYWSASDEEVRGVTEFRERFYGTSEDEESGDEVAADPYKFDSPDSIGDAVERKELGRKQKRITALEEEMIENEGLRLWVQRRDVWTGAAAVNKYGTKRPPKSAPTTQGGSSSTTPTTRSSSDASAPIEINSHPPPHDRNNATSVDLLVPVAHPLLPDNIIRKSISPKAYPDIYNKIVLSSRTPAVPINLADMTKALVKGWQEHGEWPPKALPLEALAGKKRALASPRMDSGADPFLSHHPHLQKGVESVKKIFHLNGQHHGAHGPVNG
ncbi:hypothetical protein K458DRAFT_384076 [Lentithecium fluviatile CBS 122367]|uniref:Gag1-like clamp domain-containing protein n=1 Tax=Lentithecium fluviatile CBS 122367 TaxID=1168545 RepID=A0A6G1JG64_9PLEO|nr:hypothetical protein K458DRAFT_384076 [Lentithecium fluviatile CBS 122367]